MIDGIRSGSITPFTSRSAETTAADPARPVRRVAEAGAITQGGQTALSGLVADLAKAPPVDAVRVAGLKQAVAGGSYRIDPDAIAAAMLRLESGWR